jgi:hypothetical protein
MTDRPSVDNTQDPLQKPEGEHPFWQDLNPDFLKGENYGDQGPHPERRLTLPMTSRICTTA